MSHHPVLSFSIPLVFLLIVVTGCQSFGTTDSGPVPSPVGFKPKISRKLREQRLPQVSDEGILKAPVPVPVLAASGAGASESVKKFCEKLDRKFAGYGWKTGECQWYAWHHVRDTVKGNPLIWTTYGEGDKNELRDTTLVLCGVHPDEITPIRFCFDILDHLKEEFSKLYPNKTLVIAPLVNPDGLFLKKPTRTNHRNVDLNRNFPTKDWYAKAHRMWQKEYKRDQRRYPGGHPLSEPETLFQVNLIMRYKPNKIISVHAPLCVLDYDGPQTSPQHKHDHDPGPGHGHGQNQATMAHRLLQAMSKKASDYKIQDYPYFPGSLGNWAGNERDIPTYTLELPNSDPHKSAQYWRLFKDAIRHAFLEDFGHAEATKLVQFRKEDDHAANPTIEN